MVMVREAVESTYIGVCDILENKKITRPNGSTGFEPVEVLKQQPCKLSFDRTPATSDSNNAARVETVVTLFLSPDIEVNPGSKIIVTQNGRTDEYQRSGKPAVYFDHQEITLELFGGYA